MPRSLAKHMQHGTALCSGSTARYTLTATGPATYQEFTVGWGSLILSALDWATVVVAVSGAGTANCICLTTTQGLTETIDGSRYDYIPSASHGYSAAPEPWGYSAAVLPSGADGL